MKKQIHSLLPNKDPALAIEYKLFDVTLFITVAVMLFWFAYGWFAGYGWQVQTIYGSGFVVYGFLYYAQKRRAPFRVLSLLYYLLGLLLLGVGWLPSGGLSGAVTSFLVLLYISGLLVLSVRDYLLFIGLTLILLVGYSIVELNHPDLAPPYATRYAELLDLAIVKGLMFVVVAVTILIFKKAYSQDRESLRLKNEELKQEKLRAESADHAKTVFLATMSHEIRTPLNGIVGLTELLGATRLDAEQREILTNLKYSSQVLHALIHDVLDLTAIEAGKVEIKPASCDFHAEMVALWQIFHAKKEKSDKPVEVNFEWDPQLPRYIVCDFTRMRQIVINLVSNALKFTKKGEVYIAVKALMKTDQEVLMRVSVKDTGTGIAPDKQSRLFEKFFKASDDPSVEGSGLGLSITRNLVELMGGKIGFTSTPGRGSTFFADFTFPIGQPEERKPVRAPRKVDYKGMKVLLAEDVAINQMVAKKILYNLGIKSVDLAENGQQAVDLARTGSYDLILMDIQMPVMNGIEAARTINEELKGADKVPVIVALTANALKQDRDECLAVGMKDFLVKPFDSAALMSVINQWRPDELDSGMKSAMEG